MLPISEKQVQHNIYLDLDIILLLLFHFEGLLRLPIETYDLFSSHVGNTVFHHCLLLSLKTGCC